MIPVTQDVFGREGNCMAACIASIFELPLREVPNFAEGNNMTGIWYRKLWDFCTARGFEPIYWYLNDGQHLFDFDKPEGCFAEALPYHVVSGPGSRGFLHACVGWRGQVVHDPHPSRDGLTKISDYCFLLPAKNRGTA